MGAVMIVAKTKRETMMGKPLPFCPECTINGWKIKLRRLRSFHTWLAYEPKSWLDGLLTIYICTKGCGEKFVEQGGDTPEVASPGRF